MAEAFETFNVTIHRGSGLPLTTDQMHTAVILGLAHMDGLDQLGGIKLDPDRVEIGLVDIYDPQMVDRSAKDEDDTERLEAEAHLHGRLTSPARLGYFTGGRTTA
jgi:hypothetical protein